MSHKSDECMSDLLKNKSILQILDGDTKFDVLEGVEISMPYLSGLAIVDISSMFGMQVTYGAGGTQSRWAYMEDLITHSIKCGRVHEVLACLFAKRQFVEKLKHLPANSVECVYQKMVAAIIEQINGIVYCSDAKLVVVGKKYQVVPINSTVDVHAPIINNINHSYIKDIAARAMQDIDNQHYDSAITKARTLLEEVFCYVIEIKCGSPIRNGKIAQLYKQVKNMYSMHTDKTIDERVNTLLSGLEKIVTAIAEMRNANSDAHGVGTARINILDYHARLFVNSATTMAEFVLAVSDYANKKSETISGLEKCT